MRCFLLGALLLATAPARAQPAGEIVILTGGTGGVYYPLGIALAKVYERALPGMRLTVQATQASVENFNLLQQRRGTVAFGQGDVMSNAFKGVAEAGFPSSRDRLRMVCALYPNYLHVVARKSARITSLRDLRGKRVSVGAPRSGNELNARDLLAAAGLSYADLRRVDYLAYNESVVLMRDGQLDAVIISAGLGVKAVAELAASTAVDIVPIAPELVAKSAGAFTPITIPARTYAGQPDPVPTAALSNFLVTHSDVPSELVHALVKELYANLAVLQSAHAAAGDIDPRAALVSRPIALHPGAERYFRETGLLK
jgi:TRAP transporter TAXI family solute receptor